MSEGPLPKTWGEAWPLVTWGVLIFTAGFEGISHLIVGEFVSAGIAFAIMVVLMAALLHWREIKERVGATNPNLAFIAIALMLFAVIVSPFAEKRRWPFSAVIHEPPTADDIAKAIAPIRKELDAITHERDGLQTQVDALQRQSQHPLSQPSPKAPDATIEIAKTPPHYTAFEIDMMIGTLGKLRDLLGDRERHPNKDLMRLISSARRIGPGQQPSLPSPSEAAQVADNIESYAHNLDEDSDKINDRLGEAPLLKAELSSTVIGSQEKIRKLTVSIFEMASILRQAAKNVSNDAPIGPFITQQNNNLDWAFNEYNQWLEDSIKKIEAKTREIRGWR